MTRLTKSTSRKQKSKLTNQRMRSLLMLYAEKDHKCIAKLLSQWIERKSPPTKR